MQTWNWLFSGSVIDYGYDLSNGHVDHQLAPDQNQTIPIVRSVTEVLNGAEQAGDLRQYISSLLSVDDRYVRLLAKIAEMKRALDGGLWPQISADIPPLELGDSHPEILKIRTFLVLMGDFLIAEAIESPKFDRPLQQAVMSFQSRHGIAKTGKLDRETLDEISLPIASKIDKISINLERRRWQNQPIGARHLYVNLADGQARLVENDEKIEEVPLLDGMAYSDIPSLYGSVTQMIRVDKGLRLGITAQSPGEGKQQTYSLDLDRRCQSAGCNDQWRCSNHPDRCAACALPAGQYLCDLCNGMGQQGRVGAFQTGYVPARQGSAATPRNELKPE